ncbi:MAG: cbb3-type cytochrome c oxidase subunit I [Saprospiraceae bacterium]
MKYKLIALVGLMILPFLIWAHHMFMSGVNPFISNFFVFPLVIIFLISAVYVMKKNGKEISNSSTAKLFSVGFILLLILSAINGFFRGNTAIDFQMNDTYIVVAYFYILGLFSLVFGFYAIVYFVIPMMVRKKLNETLGRIHFWLTSIVTIFLIYPIYNIGIAGVPRRYYSVEQINIYEQFGTMNIGIIIIVVVFLSQFIFLINLVYSLLSRSKK